LASTPKTARAAASGSTAGPEGVLGSRAAWARNSSLCRSFVEHGPEGHVGPAAVLYLEAIAWVYPRKGLAKGGGPQARK
jgi:hypothetical protein